MTIISNNSKTIERIIREGKARMPNFTKAESFRGFIQGQLSKYGKDDSPEGFQARLILGTILKAYNHFHPEKITEGEIIGWKGKSGIVSIQRLPDKVIVTRFQKPSKDEEPKEVEIEITREQLEAVVIIFNRMKINESIKTRDLAMEYSDLLGLGHSNWKEFFSDRKNHNLLTNILGYLDNEEIITYKGGISTLIRDKISMSRLL